MLYKTQGMSLAPFLTVHFAWCIDFSLRSQVWEKTPWVKIDVVWLPVQSDRGGLRCEEDTDALQFNFS